MNTNGTGDDPLPESRAKTVEAGLALFQEIQAERDRLREDLRRANEQITQMGVEINSLHQLHNMLESHIESYKVQRDEAVAQRAAYETLFATMQAQLRVFKLPAIPLVKDHGPQDLSDHRDHEPFTSAGGGQRPAVPDQSTGAIQVPRRSPVLAHERPMLGQRADREPTPRRYADPTRPSDT